jgi:hypothetical protein
VLILIAIVSLVGLDDVLIDGELERYEQAMRDQERQRASVQGQDRTLGDLLPEGMRDVPILEVVILGL